MSCYDELPYPARWVLRSQMARDQEAMLSVMVLGRQYQAATIAREAGITVMKAVNLLKHAQEFGSVTRRYETKNGFAYYTRVK